MEQFEFEKKRKKIKKEPIFIIISILCIIIAGIGGYFVGSMNTKTTTQESSVYDEIVNEINTHYYDTTETDYTLDERMLTGLVGAIGDQHSYYYSSLSAQNLKETINGHFVGIGLVYTMYPMGGAVVRVGQDSPAKKAGIQNGDIITHIQGTSIKGYESDKVREMIVGEASSKVKMQLLRNGKVINVEVTREALDTSVEYSIDNKQGYLKITTFGDSTGSLVKTALEEFKSKGVTELCIDFRGNGGGYLAAAQTILNLLIPQGETMYQIQSKDNEPTKEVSNSDQKYTFDKGYILVNGSTASASEVVTSALKEQLNYTIIGTKTYGKGTAQREKTLSNTSILHYTYARWLTPNGEWINGKGISPDVEVKETQISDFDINELKTTYKYDQVDNEIKTLQLVLKQCDYSLDRTDGYFSRQTETALKAFEKQYGLKQDGIYSNDDNTMLLSALAHSIASSDDACLTKVKES